MLVNDESIMLIERTSDLLEDPEILSDFVKCHEIKSDKIRSYAVVDSAILSMADKIDISSLQVIPTGD